MTIYVVWRRQEVIEIVDTYWAYYTSRTVETREYAFETLAKAENWATIQRDKNGQYAEYFIKEETVY